MKDVPERRWWGYSVGRWVDDYTFAADSIGFDDRTWLDNAGRPHSDAMKVHDQVQRTDRDHLQMTIVVDDPTFYTKPWTALILSLRLQSPKFDIREMECSPSETAFTTSCLRIRRLESSREVDDGHMKTRDCSDSSLRAQCDDPPRETNSEVVSASASFESIATGPAGSSLRQAIRQDGTRA